MIVLQLTSFMACLGKYNSDNIRKLLTITAKINQPQSFQNIYLW